MGGYDMIVQDIHLNKYDWDIRVYYALDTYYMDNILDDLMIIGCLPKELFAVEELFTSGELNKGYTFTNSKLKTSIVIIGKTSSADEFQNTFDHEKGHLVMHISQSLGIDVYSEDYQYLAGEIGREMFKEAKKFMCDCCRQKLFRR